MVRRKAVCSVPSSVGLYASTYKTAPGSEVEIMLAVVKVFDYGGSSPLGTENSRVGLFSPLVRRSWHSGEMRCTKSASENIP